MPEALSPQTVAERIESREPLAVVDVRESLDYVQGHLVESTWVPRRTLERRLPVLVPNRKTPVVVCDDRGERVALDAHWLERLGYENVSYLDGGVTAWNRAGFEVVEAADGVHATAFNYGSKKFGEEVEARRHPAKMTPDELRDRRDEAVVVDVRNPPEYEQYGTIPGSINVEGVDLALYADELREEGQSLVVHCAGRTRSIIGAATLQELGFSDVYELENGTMGWQLAGYDLDAGPGGVAETGVKTDAERYDRLRESAEGLLRESEIPFVSPDELAGLEDAVDERQTVYRFDVRTEAEFEAGHLPDAVWVAGGQLIQTTGQHVAVPDAEIVLVSENHVRAAITAYWLDEMGYPNVNVLCGGTAAWVENGGRLVEGHADDAEETRLGADRVADVDRLSPTALSERVESGTVTVVDVSELDAYADAHVPGAGWLPRNDVEAALTDGLVDAEGLVVLTCEDGAVSGAAAAQMTATLDVGSLAVLDGGLAAWRAAGLPTADGEERLLADPRNATRKPYAQGDWAMERYLEWEEKLVEE